MKRFFHRWSIESATGGRSLSADRFGTAARTATLAAIAAGAIGCSSDQPTNDIGQVAGLVTSVEPRTLDNTAPIPPLPSARRLDSHRVELYFDTGGCSTPDAAPGVPATTTGTVDSEVLHLVIDTHISCNGDSDDFAVARRAIVSISPTAPAWRSVTVEVLR